MFYNFLAASSRAMYMRYICVSKMMIKHQGILPALGRLVEGAPVAKPLRITHLNDPNLYLYSKAYILMVIQAPEQFVKNNCKPGPFIENRLYAEITILLHELHTWHMKRDQGKFPSFARFPETKISDTIIIFAKLCLFFCHQRLFDYIAEHEFKKPETLAEMREKRLLLQERRSG